jgi:regulator of RNase E activity RraA
MTLRGFILMIPAIACAQVSSSAVSEAVEQLTGKRAHMSGEIHRMAGARLEGSAVTLRLVRDDKASATEAGLTAIKLIENVSAGSVVVAVLEGDKDFAVFGATFAALARTRKLAGFVVDGAVRDLAELKGLDFPTFARMSAPGSAGGHYRIEALNAPVWCGGIEIHAGDLVIGDDDGIAAAPAGRIAEVIVAARKWQSDKQTLVPLIEKYGSYLKALQEQKAK